jgi:hypothetical protein
MAHGKRKLPKNGVEVRRLMTDVVQLFRKSSDDIVSAEEAAALEKVKLSSAVLSDAASNLTQRFDELSELISKINDQSSRTVLQASVHAHRCEVEKVLRRLALDIEACITR